MIAAVLTAKGDHTKMKHFTIDNENNISVHASKKAAREMGAGAFSTEEQLTELIGPDNKRLVEIWNSLPGVKPVTKFANRKVASERIWRAIQDLGEAPLASTTVAEAMPVPPEEEQTAVAPELAPALEVAAQTTSESATDQIAAPAKNDTPLPENAIEPAVPAPTTTPAAVATEEPLALVGAQAPDVASSAAPPTSQATTVKRAPKGKRAAKPAKAESGPREGSKTAQVVALLQRKDGATLAEIMSQMGWQRHTVRGFMAGAMKKAGHAVESFKPEGGERTYRINP